MHRLIRRMIVVSIIPMVAACGFHLRGESRLQTSMASLGLQGLDGEEFRQVLVQNLEKSGVHIVDDSKVRVVLLEHHSDRRVSAYSSRAKSAAFELRDTLTFTVVSDDKNAPPLIPQNELVAHRQLLYREDQAMGKLEEENQLRKEMEQELAERLLHKLETLTVSHP